MPEASFLYIDGSIDVSTCYNANSSYFNFSHKLITISYPPAFKTGNVEVRNSSKYLNVWSEKFTNNYHASNCTAEFSGKVLQDGVPLPNSRIRLYCRENGKLIFQVRTDENGNWLIKNLDPSEVGNYYAISLDDNPGYNAIIWDKLTPQ